MRKLISLLSICFIGMLSLLLAPAQAQITDIVTAVNKAGLQRMLGQRILKNYALVTLEVKTSDHQKDLTDTIKQYSMILADLQNSPVVAASSTEEVLESVASNWEIVKGIASALPQKDKVAELLTATEALLEVNEELTYQLAKNGGVESAAIVNVSGRQRMLSQRMAALYMLKALDMDEALYAEKIENVAFEFMLGLEELQGSDINNGVINSGLKKVQTQFKMLDFSINKKGNTYFPFVVSQAAQETLESMINITAEYATLVSSQ